MKRSYFDLSPTDDDHRWELMLEPQLCVGPAGKKFMFGGVGLAVCIQALERSCGRRVIWATSQYLSYARPGEVVELTVKELTRGKHNTQAMVMARSGGQDILMVSAALGSRPSEVSRQWLPMPDVMAPQYCSGIERWQDDEDSLHRHIDTRIAQLSSGEIRVATKDGRVLLWLKPHDDEAIDPCMLAILADFVPMGVGRAMGTNMGGNSLDNTIRIHQVPETEWVLGDLQISGVHDGFGHGAMAMFSDKGELMATAGQSLIIRSFEPNPNRYRFTPPQA